MNNQEISLWRAWLIYFIVAYLAYWSTSYILLAAMTLEWNLVTAIKVFTQDTQRYVASPILWRGVAAASIWNFIIGIGLNRYYFSRLGLEWHPVYNTLDNVSGIKLKYVVFWWAAWPFTFVRLFIAKYF